MVGGTQSQQHHQQQQPPPTQPPTTAAAAATATSAEEEALKRNTDCVYFLASPLTCKKGAECEYRHSDIARVNPRDCWFWLNANCLNPKCAFRHPPLDGLLGTQVPTPVGASIPPSQTAAIPVTSAPYNPAKQAVPCHFFQKGFCLKGDRCPFLHGPSAVNNKPPQGPAASSLSESPVLKKAIGGLEKCSQDQKVAPANTPKSAELLSHAPANIPKSAELLSHAKVVETAPPRNGVAADRHIYPSSGLDDQPSSYRLTNVVPVTNGNSISRSNRVQQVYVSDDHGTLNSRDADEFSREPSPGFDVLVDDELRDSDYYPSEDHYERARGHEGRNLNPMNDYDIAHSTDYDSMVEVDRDRYRDPRGYDSYDHMQGQYGREQRRASSERKSGGSAHLERRRYPIADSSDHIAESDLRYRLSKQRRVNGLRSVISHDRGRENHADDRSYRSLSRRDTHHIPPHESAVSSRLRGRIKLPGRSSSPVNGSNLHSEMETERGRNRGRVSPVRSHISPQQGRLRDRIKGMVPEDINNEGRSFRRTRETVNDNNSDFAGPKSLAELKSGKSAETNEASLGKRKYQMSESYRQNESDLFEGPKPLGEISKRKKAAETAVPDRSLMSGNEDYASQKGDRESLRSGLKKEKFTSGTADVGSEGRDGLVFRKEAKSADVQSPRQHNVSENETEEGMIVDDAMVDHEPEIFDQRDGESDYEQVDGEDYNLDEAENAEAEEYLDDDDDGDDFAEKMGVMFS